MAAPLTDILAEAFDEARPAARTNKQRAEWLEDDPATLSRVLNGKLALTETRAARWAEKLFPDDPPRQLEFIRRALEAPRPSRTASVEEFCQSIVESGGAVPAERIRELFEALQPMISPLICIEYRDVPRASPEAKYEELSDALAAAIAGGVAVAMFQPFGGDSNIPMPEPKNERTHSRDASAYMLKVRDDCRAAFRYLRNTARQKAAQADDAEFEPQVRLYERCSEEPYLGSGLQGKMFYIQFRTPGDQTRHKRILQWLSTPLQDVLVYRGEAHIDPDALRDTFFPVPHLFEGSEPHSLPKSVTATVIADLRAGSVKPEALPKGDDPFWKPFEDHRNG